MEAILDKVEATLCVDRSRVHGQGESNGGMMIYELLESRLAPRFASLISVIANPAVGQLELPLAPTDRKEHFRGRFLGVWGNADDTMPAGTEDGAETVKSSDGYFYRSSFSTIGTIAKHLGCTPKATEVSSLLESNLSCMAYPGCHVGEVLQCEFAGGHVWPSWLGGVLNNFYTTQLESTSQRSLQQALIEARTVGTEGVAAREVVRAA
jgi:poly(3-hydroxybutyrate) depolymerase